MERERAEKSNETHAETFTSITMFMRLIKHPDSFKNVSIQSAVVMIMHYGNTKQKS